MNDNTMVQFLKIDIFESFMQKDLLKSAILAKSAEIISKS